jgi:hypothetical protein
MTVLGGLGYVTLYWTSLRALQISEENLLAVEFLARQPRFTCSTMRRISHLHWDRDCLFESRPNVPSDHDYLLQDAHVY